MIFTTKPFTLKVVYLAQSACAKTVVKVNQLRPRSIKDLSANILAFLNAPSRPLIFLPLLLILSILVPAAPASADTGLSVLSMATSQPGVVSSNDAWNLVSSQYSLNDVDPLTQFMTGSQFNEAFTSDYLTQLDLQSQSQLALDSANLARQAQAEAEARRRAQSQSGSERLRDGVVPNQYRALVESAVSGYCPRLPVGILAAQIEAESRWNPNAASPVGARGIAQFMPATWAAHGIDANGDGKANILDPEDAIPSAAAYDCAMMDSVDDVPGDLTSNMLAAYNAGAGNVKKYQGVPPFKETQNYVSKIRARAKEMVMSDAVSGVGPEGCPTSAPANTLRKAAASMSIATICANAVAGARSPEAAAAIKYALSHVGLPYSQPKRNQDGYYDCSSFVSRAYQSAGVNIAPPGRNAPTTKTFAAASWAPRLSADELKPGDWFEPHNGHIVMVLADGLMVHTNRTGDVSHVTSLYTSAPYAAGWVDSSRV